MLSPALYENLIRANMYHRKAGKRGFIAFIAILGLMAIVLCAVAIGGE